MTIDSRVQKQGGPYPPNPADIHYPTQNSFITRNEAKQTPDPQVEGPMPGAHPTQIYNGSGGRSHRVSRG